MQKVYLLLRNNQQTGPYTFDELLQLQLRSQDLIWIEGKSYGWRYPAEVESLKPYLAAANIPAKEPEQSSSRTEAIISHTGGPQKIFVSMPLNPQPKTSDTGSNDPIEQNAEELRQRAQAYAPQQEEIRTNYSRNINEAEEEYTNWTYARKTKKKSKSTRRTLAIAGIATLIVLAGWWMKGQFFDQASTTNSLAINDKNIQEEKQTATPFEAVTEEQINPTKESKPKTENIIKEKPKEQNTNKAIVQKEVPVTETISTPEDPATDQTIAPENENDNADASVETPEARKKTLKEKIGDLFKKKETQTHQPKAADNTDSERKATRREVDNTTVSITDISDQVEIKTNKIADSWMMGVKNVKLTLYNRSELTLHAAEVEVLYYSDQNNLLEKKVLSYADIPASKSQALPIPDNRFADHIDYKILSATGVENAYVNR